MTYSCLQDDPPSRRLLPKKPIASRMTAVVVTQPKHNETGRISMRNQASESDSFRTVLCDSRIHPFPGVGLCSFRRQRYASILVVLVTYCSIGPTKCVAEDFAKRKRSKANHSGYTFFNASDTPETPSFSVERTHTGHIQRYSTTTGCKQFQSECDRGGGRRR